MSGFLTSLVAALAVAGVVAVLARRFPARVAPDDGPSLEELKPRFARVEGLAAAVYLVTAAVLTLPIWWVLATGAELRAALLPDAEHTLIVLSLYWVIPAMFLALVAAAVPTTAVLRRRLGAAYRDYERYTALKARYDARQVLRILVPLVGAGCGVMIVLGLDFYLLIARDAIVINRYFSLGEERHALVDLVEVRTAPAFTAPNGNTVHRRLYVLVFADGSRYATSYLPRDPTPAEQRVMFTELARRAGRPVVEVPIFTRADL
ncbi:MAG TPA: hypothetical protein VGT02_13400 [Methylomirabilota bacterium]|jgi:hypothetical protein|nr:hypothetical protein [Methylomirabilota bacterium]